MTNQFSIVRRKTFYTKLIPIASGLYNYCSYWKIELKNEQQFINVATSMWNIAENDRARNKRTLSGTDKAFHNDYE